MYVEKQGTSLVIANIQEEEDDEDDPSPYSPRNDGDYSAGFTIKGKKSDNQSSKILRYRLHADIILTNVVIVICYLNSVGNYSI